jgi:sporulation protein YlmC with PRC-barrel domain
MVNVALRVSSVLAVLAAVVVLTPPQVPAGKEKQSVQPVRAKTLLGAKVAIQGGTGVGTVDDIVLTDEGVVDFLIVSEGGKLVTVPWEAIKFNYEKRMAIIDIPHERYQQVPTYSVEQYPNFYAPTYRVQVYKAYGLTPGQERRLERRIERKP